MFSSRNKLSALSSELETLYSEVPVLEEQLVYLESLEDDARLRAIVSESPLARQEHKEATKSLQAIQRDHKAKKQRITKLEKKRNRLLR